MLTRASRAFVKDGNTLYEIPGAPADFRDKIEVISWVGADGYTHEKVRLKTCAPTSP
jgi:hypothetical protein